MSSRKSLSFKVSDHNFVCIYYLYQFNLRPTHPFILVLTLLEVFYKNTDSEVHQDADFLDSNCFIFLKYKYSPQQSVCSSLSVMNKVTLLCKVKGKILVFCIITATFHIANGKPIFRKYSSSLSVLNFFENEILI